MEVSDLASAANPSRPSRAYLHLTHPQYLGPLADQIRAVAFADARGSSSDSVLLGPPTLVFTPFSKIPGKSRTDGRQGTIDQDPEFIDFLASLTNPVIKPTNIGLTTDKESKLTDAKMITPLVQYIKDKKANKSKDGKSQKHIRQESKDGKVIEKKTAAKSSKGKAVAIDKKLLVSRVEKPKSEIEGPPKIVGNPQGANAILPIPASPAVPIITQPLAPTPPKTERRRERGNASLAAKILQRDLALASGASSRRRRDNPMPGNGNETQKGTTLAETVPLNSAATSTSSAIATPPSMPAQIPSGPAATRKPQQPQNPSAQRISPAPLEPSTMPSSTTTQAFLKHANPSQGVTESLLEEAFRAFGVVVKVEIDKKKGFAYLDFAEASSLQKAIAASPVKVAQGQVVVLERKTGSVLQNRNARGQQASANIGVVPNRGGRGGGRGRSGRGSAGTPKIPNTTPVNVPSSTPVPART